MTSKAIGSVTEVVSKAFEKFVVDVEQRLIAKMLIIVSYVFM
jgi:hypothetical protein